MHQQQRIMELHFVFRAKRGRTALFVQVYSGSPGRICGLCAGVEDTKPRSGRFSGLSGVWSICMDFVRGRGGLLGVSDTAD